MFLCVSTPGQEILKNARARAGKQHDHELDLSQLQQVVHEFKKLANVPEDPWKQLHEHQVNQLS